VVDIACMLLSCRAPPSQPRHLQLPQPQARRVRVHKTPRASAPHQQHQDQHLDQYVHHSSSAKQQVPTAPTVIVARVLQVGLFCALPSSAATQYTPQRKSPTCCQLQLPCPQLEHLSFLASPCFTPHSCLTVHLTLSSNQCYFCSNKIHGGIHASHSPKITWFDCCL
jgi:hypothetical protein